MSTTLPILTIIKGDHLTCWDQVQAIQDQPFLYIVSNGSHWGGELPDDLDSLLATLAEEPLDLIFEECGDFIDANPCYGVQGEHFGEYVNGPRMFSGSVTTFFGNFYTVSHVFNLYTNDPATIEALTRAIRDNQQTTAYGRAKTERGA